MAADDQIVKKLPNGSDVVIEVSERFLTIAVWCSEGQCEIGSPLVMDLEDVANKIKKARR